MALPSHSSDVDFMKQLARIARAEKLRRKGAAAGVSEHDDTPTEIPPYAFGGFTLFVAWLLVNLLVAKPIFAWINRKSFDSWRCLPDVRHKSNASIGTLDVIVASPGDMRTASLQVALESMGLRTYRGVEMDFYLDELLRGTPTSRDLIEPLNICGVKALIAEPWMFDLMPGLVAANPGASIILTGEGWLHWSRSANAAAEMSPVQGYPHSYFSMLASLALCHWLPDGLLWRSLPGDQRHSFLTNRFTSLVIQHCIVWVEPPYVPIFWRQWPWPPPVQATVRRAQDEFAKNRSAFDKYIQGTRNLVAAERLLEFRNDENGWAQLTAFTGRSAPSGVAYPRLGRRSSSPEFAELDLFPTKFVAFWLFLCCSLLANAALFCYVVTWITRLPVKWQRRASKHAKQH